MTPCATYADAAEVATEWGLAVEDSTLHALVQQAGAKAQAQTQARLEQPPVEREPQRAPTPLLNLMIDGCQIRFRGPGWGHPHSDRPHVEWHELKVGVCYRQEALAVKAGERGTLSDKRVVSWRGEAGELGRRLHWEAQAEPVLDFYHASGHLHTLAEAVHGADSAPARQQAKTWRRRLRRGNAAKLLGEIAALEAVPAEAGAVVRREQNYLAGHAHRMDYRALALSGPIGSGTVESACRSRQCRFKRPGQFWTDAGLRNLCALQEARRNHHWEELWKS